MKKTIFVVMACVLGLSAQAQSTWSYGEHQYTMKGNLTAEKYNRSATGVVTFTNVRRTMRSLRHSTRSSWARRPTVRLR